MTFAFAHILLDTSERVVVEISSIAAFAIVSELHISWYKHRLQVRAQEKDYWIKQRNQCFILLINKCVL